MSVNILAKLGDLIGAGPLSRDALTIMDDEEWLALVKAGAVIECGPPKEILCQECDEGHLSEIEWQNDGYVAFCPEAGFVPVQRAFLSRVELQPLWWITELARSLKIVNPRCQALIEGKAWFVDHAIHAGFEWRVICIVGEVSSAYLDGLVDHIERLPPRLLTVVITLSSGFQSQSLARHKIWLLRLADIANVTLKPNIRINIDQQALIGWLKGFDRGQCKPMSTGGNPGKNKSLVNQFIAEYCSSNQPIKNKSLAAREILVQIKEVHPDADAPTEGTIRNRLREMELHETA